MSDQMKNESIALETALSDDDFTELRKIVHSETGITIADNRRRMLFSRLQKRLRISGEQTFKNYIAKVLADPSEMQELTNCVTTNETYFYRTPRIWSHFRKEVVPRFLETNRSRTMKVWSAAASSGEEAHTLGAILEQTRADHPGFDYTILGTDISSRVLSIARTGLYSGRSIARFKNEEPSLFQKYMIGNDSDGYRTSNEISRRILFRRHNLLSTLAQGGPFDVIFLRNVLIYFTDSDQENILRNIRAQLRSEGTLIIGESETLKSLDCDFEAVEPLIYRPC